MLVIFLKKIIFIIICFVIGIFVYRKNDEIVIPSDAIRIRIIANSNNIEDLYQKKRLKEEIKNDIYNLVKNANNTMEAGVIIKNNLDNIDSIIRKKTNNYKIDYGMNYFPSKTYKGVVYPSGEYESLVITLGSGLGDNWWCVLYPPLCMIEENNNTSDVEYQFLVSKILGLQ